MAADRQTGVKYSRREEEGGRQEKSDGFMWGMGERLS
jgi:hypothetical protein